MVFCRHHFYITKSFDGVWVLCERGFSNFSIRCKSYRRLSKIREELQAIWEENKKNG